MACKGLCENTSDTSHTVLVSSQFLKKFACDAETLAVFEQLMQS